MKITIGQLKEWLQENNIPDDTQINALVGNLPCTLKRIVYCPEYNQVTLNPMGTHLDKDHYKDGVIKAILD
jgi:hypothetical protein